MSTLSIDERLSLMRKVGEEIVGEEKLRRLFESDKDIVAYDGFEPSGRMHIGSGLLRAINVNRSIQAGIKFKLLVADWHAWANHKIGGDLEKIQNVGNYFIEVWRASGMDLDNVEFVWASDLVKQEGYWETVMKIAIGTNLPRVLRTLPALGRGEDESLAASFILYPLMQVADIFVMDVNVTQLGMDQRKVNMLAREVAPKLGFTPPVVASSHLLLGLAPPSQGEGATKMSKSVQDSSIWMTDTKKEVERKIKKAWAPEGKVENNPILEICRYIIFAQEEKMLIDRPKKYGGLTEYATYDELEKAYSNKELFPLDLKVAVIEYLDKYLEPVRRHFDEDEEAKKLKELVESYEVTR